jgi:hypothetical protein
MTDFYVIPPIGKVKVKIKQSHFRPEQAQRVDRYIALSFRDLGARRGCVVRITPRPPHFRERPGTHCTGGYSAE